MEFDLWLRRATDRAHRSVESPLGIVRLAAGVLLLVGAFRAVYGRLLDRYPAGRHRRQLQRQLADLKSSHFGESTLR